MKKNKFRNKYQNQFYKCLKTYFMSIQVEYPWLLDDKVSCIEFHNGTKLYITAINYADYN